MEVPFTEMGECEEAGGKRRTKTSLLDTLGLRHRCDGHVDVSRRWQPGAVLVITDELQDPGEGTEAMQLNLRKGALCLRWGSTGG